MASFLDVRPPVLSKFPIVRRVTGQMTTGAQQLVQLRLTEMLREELNVVLLVVTPGGPLHSVKTYGWKVY